VLLVPVAFCYWETFAVVGKVGTERRTGPRGVNSIWATMMIILPL
jgi:hypothetical protein